MTHRFSARLALFAAGVCLPAAAAQAGSGSCPGENFMAEETRGTTVIRSGSGHSHTVVQDDPDGTLRLEQHGKDHAALAVQQGQSGKLAIEQSGSSASAEVTQGGACNATELAQSGNGNRATVTQSGNGNRVVVRQGPSKE